MSRDRWYPEERREARRVGWLTFRWYVAIIVAVVVVGAVIGGAVWAVNVATSGVRGQGDGIAQRNSAENWLEAQARFEENFAEYEATLARIDQFHQVHLADPADAVARTNWLGQISHCTDVVADYNADARNFLRADFRAADLPDSLDLDTCTETQS